MEPAFVEPVRIAESLPAGRRMANSVVAVSSPKGRTVVRNLAGAAFAGTAFAAYLLLPNLEFFLQNAPTNRSCHAVQQAWVWAVSLFRRAPRSVSSRPLEWFVTYAAWFTSFLVRSGGYHPAWAAPDEYVYEAMKAGASGFILKNVPPAKLVDAVRTVAGGEALLALAITRRMIERFVQRAPTGTGRPLQLAELTERELSVLRLIASPTPR
jgi:hypothetical protein